LEAASVSAREDLACGRPRRVELDARAHRRRQRHAAQVTTLGAGRLRLDDLIDHCGIVLEQRQRLEARLADRQVDDRLAIGPILDLAGLRLVDGLGYIVGHGADLRVRHQALRAEHTPQASDLRHLIGGGDRHVEIGPTRLDPLGKVIGADEVGAGLLRLAGLLTLGEDGDGDVAAGAVRERQRPAELLVRMADIDAEADMQLDRLVEAGRGQRLQQADGLGRVVVVVAIDPLDRSAESLASRHG
jgi:hypothetical protein